MERKPYDVLNNTPPLKRVDLKPPEREYPPPLSPGLKKLEEVNRNLEAERIWRLVVESSRDGSP